MRHCSDSKTTLVAAGAVLCAMLCPLWSGAAAAQSVSPPPEHQRQADEAMQTPSGQNGKQEPKPATAHPDHQPVLLQGRLNVPGAAADGETVPAKFSKRNDAIDKLPIMAYPLALDDRQQEVVRAAVRGANKPIVRIEARLTEELSNAVPAYEIPDAVIGAVPSLRGLKYVPLKDKILLVYAPNMIVVGEIGV